MGGGAGLLDARCFRAVRRLGWRLVGSHTTVGYGDFSPKTDGGIAMFAMVVGIGFVVLLTAAAAERFIRRRGDPPAVDEAPRRGERSRGGYRTAVAVGPQTVSISSQRRRACLARRRLRGSGFR